VDQGTLQGIGTVLVMLAFGAICWWAYSGRNKSRFEEAAQLPFADDGQLGNEEPGNKESNTASDGTATQGIDNARSGL
jgi:cytochrome c oxidase cbb3-type subunit 4